MDVRDVLVPQFGSCLNYTPEMPHYSGTMKPSVSTCLWPLVSTYLPTLASGVLLAWCFPTYHLYWLAWVALAPLFFRTASLPPLTTALHFFLCGHLFHTLTLQWLCANIFWAGGWAFIGQQFLCFALSLCWAVTGLVWAIAHGRSSRFGGALCLAGLWAAMEVVQARAFSGFGWCALGYTQGPDLLAAQFAAIGGVTLLSFCVVLVNALIALILSDEEFRIQRLVAVPLLLGLVHGGGYLLLKDADYASAPLQTGVIQPNFSQEMKWDPAYDYEMLQRTAQMTRALTTSRPVDLVVWPEALIVRHFENPVFKEALSRAAVDSGSYIFTGTTRDDYGTSKNYNSSALITPEGNLVGIYDKVHLAAFGEYVPLENYFPFLSKIAFGGVSPGEKQVTLPLKDRDLGPLICFEVLFAPLAEKLRHAGAELLVVVTNLAWFGGSNAIPQELEIARMRAIETRLPLIHSSNTGISGVFDPYGRFSVVRHTVSPEGELLDWGVKVRPKHVVMRRFLDSFPLAAPAARPLPGGPVFFPWLLAFIGVGMAVLAFVQPVYTRFTETECSSHEAELKPESQPETKSKPKRGGNAKAPKGPAGGGPRTNPAPRKRKSKGKNDGSASKQEEFLLNPDQE